MSRHELDCIFRPDCIAVVGASNNPEKFGYKIFKNILDAGFQGEVFPVNPKGEEILGRRSLRSVDELPEGVDLAVIIIPAKSVPDAIMRCGKRGVKASIIITGGFSEAGREGEILQQEVLRNARDFGIRLIGPNCQGVNYPYHHLCASWPLITLKGDIAIISQSGTVGAALIDWASQEKLGFSAFVSMGNRADVDESDLIEYFSQDTNTKVIALYIEGIKDAGKFLRVMKNCRKPVVILKSGRTERGIIAAESHTKSLAGRDEVYDALFKKFGIHRALDLEELYDISKALAYVKKPAGRRMLIVTSSGGSGIIATDTAEECGFDVAPLPEELEKKLREMLPPHFIISNPLDLTGDADAQTYKRVIQEAGPYYDIVTIVFGDPIENASSVVNRDRCELVIFLGGADVERREKEIMHMSKIAVFPTPERGIKAASHHLSTRKKTITIPKVTPTGKGKRLLSPYEALQFLSSRGIITAKSFKTNTLEDALSFASNVGYPVVLKINSKSVSHKSDVGGVILDIRDEIALRSGFSKLISLGLETDGLLISEMVKSDIEVIVGAFRDLQFGPVAMFGLGGIMVEVIRDVSFRIAPLRERDALEMIDEIKGSRVLHDFRGKGMRDKGALANLIVDISKIMMEDQSIDEIDLNPVASFEKGYKVLDARIVMS